MKVKVKLILSMIIIVLIGIVYVYAGLYYLAIKSFISPVPRFRQVSQLSNCLYQDFFQR